MRKLESETFERSAEIVSAMNKALIALCIMLEREHVPLRDMAEIGLAFGESKATLWHLADRLHDEAKSIRREEVKESPQ